MESKFGYFIFLIPVLYFAWQIYQSKKKDLIKIKNSFGQIKEKNYIYEEFTSIANSFYHQLNNKVGFMDKKENYDEYIDDITWNDLDMDEVYKKMDSTYSSLGQEELYRILRFTNVCDDELAERKRIMDYFAKNDDERTGICYRYKGFGFSKKMSVADYIEGLDQCEKTSIFPLFSHILLLFAAIIYCLCFDVVRGLWSVILVSAFNIIMYYRRKAGIENYFLCLKQFYLMCNLAKKIIKSDVKGIKEYTDYLDKLLIEFRPVRNFSFIMSSGKGNIIEFILDYVRILTHLDLIKFYFCVDKLKKKKKEVIAMYRTLGYIDALIAAASYRKSLDYCCEPKFSKSSTLTIADMFHPLIENPVSNSISSGKCILITGSNASGKSTFLRGTGLCVLMAQTLFYCPAKQYAGNRYRIYSSMALKDNLMGSESYYMVEIKSLKRIMDAAGISGNPVICFIDEVLRGTNTIERIAASSQILKSLSKNNCLCFAATHDIELTSILEKYYVNYHFSETISDNDISFEYKIYDGKATSRNAIKLLGFLGYEKNILDEAQSEAIKFERNGSWEILL